MYMLLHMYIFVDVLEPRDKPLCTSSVRYRAQEEKDTGAQWNVTYIEEESIDIVQWICSSEFIVVVM